MTTISSVLSFWQLKVKFLNNALEPTRLLLWKAVSQRFQALEISKEFLKSFLVPQEVSARIQLFKKALK